MHCSKSQGAFQALRGVNGRHGLRAARRSSWVANWRLSFLKSAKQ